MSLECGLGLVALPPLPSPPRRRSICRRCEGPGLSSHTRLSGRLRRSDPANVRPSVLHSMSEPIPCRVRPLSPSPTRHRRELQSHAFRCGRQHRQDKPPLQGARLPHEGAALGHRPVHPALHETGRPHPGRILRFGDDRRCSAMVRLRTGKLQTGTSSAVGRRRPGAAAMGRPEGRSR